MEQVIRWLSIQTPSFCSCKSNSKSNECCHGLQCREQMLGNHWRNCWLWHEDGIKLRANGKQRDNWPRSKYRSLWNNPQTGIVSTRIIYQLHTCAGSTCYCWPWVSWIYSGHACVFRSWKIITHIQIDPFRHQLNGLPWCVGGSQSFWRNPTQTCGEHAEKCI